MDPQSQSQDQAQAGNTQPTGHGQNEVANFLQSKQFAELLHGVGRSIAQELGMLATQDRDNNLDNGKQNYAMSSSGLKKGITQGHVNTLPTVPVSEGPQNLHILISSNDQLQEQCRRLLNVVGSMSAEERSHLEKELENLRDVRFMEYSNHNMTHQSLKFQSLTTELGYIINRLVGLSW